MLLTMSSVCFEINMKIESAMTFYEYMVKRRKTNTPNGDFVSDSLGMKGFPDVKTWDQLRSYIRSKRYNVHQDVIDAARNVWRAYVKAEERQGRTVSV